MFHYSYLLKDQPIQISLNEVFSGEFGTTTWPSSAQLAKVIFRNESAFDKKVVLELGCGSGLSGIAAAKCGSTVYLTDLSEPSSILANCKENCAINHVEDRTLIVLCILLMIRSGHFIGDMLQKRFLTYLPLIL